MGAEQHVLTDAPGLAVFMDQVRPRIECALDKHLPRAAMGGDGAFNAALRDAVFPGGQRLRAILAVLASQMVLADDADALTAAVAVEYLHSCALVFDDLPAMDDASERRGRPCLHLRYGEGVAMVAALALMNAAFSLVATQASRGGAAGLKAVRELTKCVSTQISGQAADLALSPAELSDQWQPIRDWKTSALFRLSMTLGPTLSGARYADVAALGRCGQLLGEAYQTIDDARDVSEDTALSHRGRAGTFAMHSGTGSAIQRANSLTSRAERCLVQQFGDLPAVNRLCEFASQWAESG